jgi:hypothetical protein
MPTILPPSKWETRARALSYLFTGFVGVAVIFWPRPTIIEDAIGYPVLIAWGIFMLTAFPAAVATYRGKYLVEYAFLPFFTVALMVANVSTWVNVTVQDITLVPRASVGAALILAFITRMIVLWHVVDGQPRRKRHHLWTRN